MDLKGFTKELLIQVEAKTQEVIDALDEIITKKSKQKKARKSRKKLKFQ